MMTVTDNREAAIKLLFSIPDGLDPGSVTPDFTWWIQGRGEKTLAEFNESLAALAGMRVGRSRYGVRGITSQGDRVAVELEGLTALTGNRLYNNSYHFLVAFRDGVPCRVREYLNTAYAADIFGGHNHVNAINQPHDDQDAEADVGGATSEERTALVIRLVESVSTGEGMATDLLTPDARWWVQGHGSVSLAGFKAAVVPFEKIWAGPGKLDVLGVTVEGTRVALETESRIPLIDGRTYHNSYHLLAKFRGDKIRELREYHDSLYFRATFPAGPGENPFSLVKAAV